MYVGMWIPSYGIVMPKDYIESKGLEYYMNHPIGVGPYKMVRYSPGDTAKYEAFEQYWRGVPAFKTLALILVPEATTRGAMLKTGEADVVDTDMESAVELERAGLRAYVTSIYTAQVHFNGVHDPMAAGMPLADVRVRQALALAINGEEMGKTLFLGKMGPAMPAFLSENSWDIDVPYWRDYAAKLYRYDPEEAKRLLAEAGYAKGLSIKLYTYVQTGRTWAPKVAEVVQSYWARIGVSAQITPVDWGTMRVWVTARPQAKELIGTASSGGFTAEPHLIRALIMAYTTGTYGLYSGTRYYDELHNLLLAAQSETDNKKRLDMVAQVVKTVTDSYTSIQIGSVPSMAVIGPKVDADLPRTVIGLPYYTDYFKHRK